MPLPPAEPVSPTLKSARRATKEGVLRKSHRGRPFAQGASDRHFVCVGFHVAYFTDASRRAPALHRTIGSHAAVMPLPRSVESVARAQAHAHRLLRPA